MATEAIAKRVNQAALAMACAMAVWVVATVAIPLIWSPESAVRDYLDDVRHGDTVAALEDTGGPAPNAGKHNTGLLKAAALSSDWSVRRVAAQDPTRPGITPVEVTIGHGDLVSRGTFFVSGSGPSSEILNPFVYVDSSDLPTSFLDLNGMTREVGLPLPHGAKKSRAPSVVLFPGYYRLYAKHRQWISPDPSALLAMPGDDVADHSIGAAVTLSAKGQRTVNAAMHKKIDTCVASHRLAPRGCPFLGGDAGAGVVETESHRYGHLRDLAWSARGYPTVSAAVEDGRFHLGVTDEATLRLSGTGVDLNGHGGKRHAFRLVCRYVFEWTTARLKSDMSLSLSIDDNHPRTELTYQSLCTEG